MKQIRERVLQIMDELDKLSEHDYRVFELALALFMRADKETVKDKRYLSDKELEELDRFIGDFDGSFMNDDLKDKFDETLLLF